MQKIVDRDTVEDLSNTGTTFDTSVQHPTTFDNSAQHPTAFAILFSLVRHPTRTLLYNTQ